MALQHVPRFRFRITPLPLALVLVTAVAVAARADDRAARLVAVQDVIADLLAQLGLPVEVSTTVVRANALLVSVEPVQGRTDAFRLVLEDGFLERLDESDVRAVIAHELGHVYIFTHHPYLQTERLANDIALRVVPSASLEQVYRKVWQRIGLKGDLSRFLRQ